MFQSWSISPQLDSHTSQGKPSLQTGLKTIQPLVFKIQDIVQSMRVLDGLGAVLWVCVKPSVRCV